MRELSELIEEVKFNTNNVDSVRFSDVRLIKFFNSAVREIQKIVFLANNDTNLGAKTASIDLIANQESYPLPDDMYADNGIISVCYADGENKNTGSLSRISSKGRNSVNYGYVTIGKSIHISPVPMGSSPKILIVYYAQLDLMEDTSEVPELPDACEEFLMLFVERKIHYVDSSNEIQVSGIFTKEEKQEITTLFAENCKDAPEIPITDFSFYCW